MNTFPLDAYTRGAHFLNLTAAMEGDHIHLSGQFQSASLIPVLLFSVGVPWVDPCVKHVCCLWDVAERYKDHDLIRALGSTCNENVDLSRLDLLKGGSARDSEWTVDTMIHPSFVAMLFVSLAPIFYMSYEILPMQWIDGASLHWQSSWYGQACHQVLYPNGQQVCITCFNSKPENAVYVFSANWFSTFQCKWVCKPGFTGPNCEITVDLAIYITSSLVAVFLLGGMVLCVLEERRQRRKTEDKHVEDEAVAVPIPPPTPRASNLITTPPSQSKKIGSDMIVFKENTHEIRIKLL
jgi:hypothetical protein